MQRDEPAAAEIENDVPEGDIPHGDIFLAARHMVQRHGHLAPIECARAADRMHIRGDSDREALWLAVREVAQRLLEFGPPADIPGLPSA